jgi:rubrerythrin
MNPYDFAIQMSRDGEKFFRTLTKQVKKSGLRKILVTLANDQAIHRRDLAKMKKAEGKTLPDAANLAGAVNPFAQRLKRLGRGERLDENLPPADLYRRGQALDKECEDFYRKRAGRVKNPRLKRAFLEVAEEQRKHHISLEHLINFITEPQQKLEDAEWSITEPLE